MEGLNYRETLNKNFKLFRGMVRSYDGFKNIRNGIVIDFVSVKLEIKYFNEDIVKIFISENEKATKTNAVVLKEEDIKLKVLETNEFIEVIGEKVITKISKKTSKISFYDSNNTLLCSDYEPSFKDEEGNIYISKINDSIAYYGLGEKGGDLNKKGYYTENFNTDDPETDDNSVMYYKTIPFFLGLGINKRYGLFFDNSYRSFFDMGKEYGDRIFFGANGGQIQYYFIYGGSLKEVVCNYTKLTGKMDMPPLWSLGYQQNRFSYFDIYEVREVIKEFEKREIPIDVIYLDIDYMDGFRVMTFKSPQFDGVKELIEELKAKGIKTITILDPGVKVDEEYGVYKRGKEGNYFTKKADGETFIGAVWPGDSAFPDFSNSEVRTWWKEELKSFIKEYNIDGIWNDMNEPCVFNTDYKTMPDTCIHKGDYGVMEHKEFHNRYGFEMSRCSHEAQKELKENIREFSMTRATYAGGQRYSSVWTGDNISLFSQLRMSISMNANLGMSGFSFVGNDVGGFGGDCNEELLIRWTQVGTFLPIFRNHSNMYTRRQEPWAFGENCEEICKKAIDLRYELMPYIYTAFYDSYNSGIPMFRPLILEFEDDINVINIKEQFMVGDNLMIAPVMNEGEREKYVYLPKGNWYNYFTEEMYEGNRGYMLKCPLNEILIFVKEGSVIPIYKEKYFNMENKPKEFYLKIFGAEATGKLYNDDGISMDYKKGKFNLIDIHYNHGKLELNYKVKGLEEEIIK
ncbi:glycoside hydrolase family 31 protein [uncultured Clostridium sp.]|uniref:glycoside hydrolase family 31 protein n=1 Tax=uncultured Clostridium sp. TaxID=59620 RepID=UPI0026355C30|nr:glycoside hydrolase family 31 protein [uncultured Clostridium sp.]